MYCCERQQGDRGGEELGPCSQAPSWNSSSAVSYLHGLGQVTHALCLSFPIYKKGISALPDSIEGMITRVSWCEVCASLQSELPGVPRRHWVIGEESRGDCTCAVTQGQGRSRSSEGVWPLCAVLLCSRPSGTSLLCKRGDDGSGRSGDLRPGRGLGGARSMGRALSLGATRLPVSAGAGCLCHHVAGTQ